MTDSEIIKALGYCKDCSANLNAEIVEHIHRKNVELLELTEIITRQKAEIERLENRNVELWVENRLAYKKAKSEARREFADRLIAKADKAYYRDTYMCVDVYDIDNLLKEMESDSK